MHAQNLCLHVQITTKNVVIYIIYVTVCVIDFFCEFKNFLEVRNHPVFPFFIAFFGVAELFIPVWYFIIFYVFKFKIYISDFKLLI